MRLSWILPACVAALGALPAAAFAQNQEYETPLYTSQPPAALDPNYGLPTFGMPGSELPQQKTMTPEKPVPAEPDFFKGSADIVLPKPKSSTQADSQMETPRYTTSDGSATDDTTSSDGTAPK